MALSIEDLLLGTNDQLARPEKAAALAGALKGQRNYGLLGQLMNLEPTKAAGSALLSQADTGLKMGVARQEKGLERAIAAEQNRLERERSALDRETEERRHQEMLGLRQREQQRAEDTAEQTRLYRQEDARKPIEESIYAGETILQNINQLRTHPAMESSLGYTGRARRLVPRSPELDFSTREKQLMGQNFLQAFQSLKGGGPITDIEGQKATDAMSRLNAAMSADQYKAALDELEALVNSVIDRRRREAGRRGIAELAPEPVPDVAPPTPAAPAPAAPAYRYDAQGRRIR